MRHRNREDFFAVDKDGHILREQSSFQHPDQIDLQSEAPPATDADEVNGTPVPVGGGVIGRVDAGGDVDYYTVHLEMGQTYMFSLQGGGAEPIDDAYLMLFNPGGTFIKDDDDGGVRTSSIITYTATATGDYFLGAASFGNVGDPGLGTYALDVRQQGADAVGNTNATAGTLDIGGYVFGFRETGSDVDRYAVTLEAGKLYTFQLAGGADYATNPNAVPTGELDTILRLRAADGTLLVQNDDNSFPGDISSGLSYFATTSGTFYLDVTAYSPQTGGYVLQSDAPVDPADYDPLESLNWDTAPNVPFVDTNGDGKGDTAYIYFAHAGENFGLPEVTGVGTMLSEGWQQFQIDGVMNALKEYEALLGVKYVIVESPENATFRMMTTTNATFGARFYNYDPQYGAFKGIGIFNNASGGFGTRPESLVKGGFSYGVVLHEFGHAHGIAHPHDHGGGSEVMLGVTGATGSYGVYDLNQGVYTVMSYNEAWDKHPDGPTTQSPTGSVGQVIDHGWSLFGAFDVAVLKERYGLADQNVGNTTYTLNDDYHTAYYNTIVDTNGTDTIAYGGSLDAQIDLQAATLDYSPLGGGAISFLHNAPGVIWQQQVKGGFTIANGVVIENATGGSGNDLLIGNSANNVLTGNAGNDTLAGRTGIDVYRTGTGADTVIISLDQKTVETKKGGVAYDLVTDFDGVGDKLDFSDLDAKIGTATNDAFKWIGTNANKNAGDLSYKVYDSLNGAEKALGIEIDNYTGAHNGKVTVVMANVDGGAVDYMVVLLGAPVLTADDFTL